MDNLGAHIIEILRTNPKVSLAGIGTFKKERIPAIYDKNSNSYLAPTQRILLEDREDPDSLIINSIANGEGLSLQESERKLQLALASIKKELAEKGESLLPEFGRLVKNENTGYNFIAEDKDEVPLYKPVNELKLITPASGMPLSQAKEIESPRTPSNVDIEPATNKWLWPILFVTFIIVGGTAWLLRPLLQQQAKETIAPIDSGSTSPASETIITPPTGNASVAEDSTSTQLGDSSSATTGLQPTFEIIIVSFEKLPEAEKYVAKMNAKGYKIRILENHKPGNLYKISYSSYSTEEEARKELIRVKSELSKDAWILKNNHL